MDYLVYYEPSESFSKGAILRPLAGNTDMHMKKILMGVAAAALFAASAVPAFAASNDYCGSSANGCAQAALVGAQCGSGAASGAFGAFGKDNNMAGGANGTKTGLNNSAVCGNR
jgi:hypothetical protein